MKVFYFACLFLLIFSYSQAGDEKLKDIAVVVKDSKYGIVDGKGKLIVPCLYEYLKITCSDLIEAKKNGKFGYIDRYGNVKIDFIYEATSGFYAGKATVVQNDQYRFIDENGKYLFDLKFDYAHIFSEGLAGVCNSGACGFIDEKGKMIIKPQVNFAFTFHHGYCIAIKDSNFGVINRKGETIIPFEYDVILETRIPLVFHADKKYNSTLLKIKNNEYKDILKRKAYRTFGIPDFVPFDQECEPRMDSPCLLFKDDSMGLINVRTEKILCCYNKIIPLSPYFFSCIKQLSYEDRIVSVIDTSGNVVGDFKEYEVTRVLDSLLIVNDRKGGYIGGINFKKDTILGFSYGDILGMKNGIVLVSKADQNYLIKINGDIVSKPFSFRVNSCVFFDHIIIVRSGDKYGIIDYKGNVIQEPQFDKPVNFYPNVFSE